MTAVKTSNASWSNQIKSWYREENSLLPNLLIYNLAIVVLLSHTGILITH